MKNIVTFAIVTIIAFAVSTSFALTCPTVKQARVIIKKSAQGLKPDNFRYHRGFVSTVKPKKLKGWHVHTSKVGWAKKAKPNLFTAKEAKNALLNIQFDHYGGSTKAHGNLYCSYSSKQHFKNGNVVLYKKI